MAKISEAVISEILSKTDIVDLISEKVSLSKKGKSYFGLCPFHNEKTPSFSVEPERKIFNCFSCGEKGNAIGFLQKTQNLSFVEAIENLADRANVSIDFTKYKRENPNKKFLDINKDASNFYKLYLSSTKQGIVAKDYLLKRGISDEIIEKFSIGLSPTEFDLLYKTLTEKGILVSDLYDLGLVKQSKKENFYDLFRERIIFPILDEYGNVVGFSGRTYLDKDDDGPKYINSPQTIVFTKSNVLYNMNNAINEIKKNNRIVLFEGYMDVIAAYRAGVKESVASMGTSLTNDQVRLMKKYTNNVTICYDGDPAGVEATERAIKLFEQAHMEIKIILLPDKLDPDDYLKKYSAKELNKFINDNWIDKIEFAYLKSNMNIDFTKMLDIEHFKKIIFDLIKNSSNTIIESYINRLSKDVKVSTESIRQDFNQYTKRNIRNLRSRNIPRMEIERKYAVAERNLVNYYIKDFKYVKTFNNEFGEVFYIEPIVRDIKMIIEDVHYKNLEASKESIIDEEELLKLFNPDQLLFYTKRVKYKMAVLDDKEYRDLMGVIQKYLEYLVIQELEEKIRNAPTMLEKIKLAEYRDVKIKEAKYGQR
ncbi:MAG: DNA primase [Candidatus Izimaplasma bacterium HR2]|nr:MAG: DNA primase [Candidatus Izimaplasma bacterium HR2]